MGSLCFCYHDNIWPLPIFLFSRSEAHLTHLQQESFVVYDDSLRWILLIVLYQGGVVHMIIKVSQVIEFSTIDISTIYDTDFSSRIMYYQLFSQLYKTILDC